MALIPLDFLVVQETFMSETAKFANVVLPGASFFAKSGTFTNGERRVQRVNEVIPPPALESRAPPPPRCARPRELANLAYIAAAPFPQERSESQRGTATVLFQML